MAQAFEIPKEVTRAHSRALAAGSGASRRKVSATHFSRSPLPVRPRGRIGTGNMGLPPDRRKRIDLPCTTRDRPDSRRGYHQQRNRFWRI